MAHPRLFFDINDFTLLRIVNDVLARSPQSNEEIGRASCRERV